MVRERTPSSIQKSKRDEAAKEQIRKDNARWASKRYRLKNKDEINKAAKARMAKLRAGLDNAEHAQRKEHRKNIDKKHYLKNQDHILSKAEDKRWKAHIEKNGDADWAYGTYRSRRSKRHTGPREGE
ncbi:hypothetical protein BDP27DRAFT_1422930 [Rhodocollybia butyracea]|uniref:Uncharacterized protein n=1 Tax=Rhodocollybia butyracea TaxID=206335 RepID=A0A9P5PQH8_9AGAR|nr:hypothetical protein BDP27DRAFT_1422930 [Rhodocollybia butyracea]